MYKRLAKKKPSGDPMQIYKRLLEYARPHWLPFLVAVFASIIYSGVDSVFAYLLKPLIDKGFVSPDLTFLKWLPLIIIFLFVVRMIANLIGSYYMSWVGRSVVMTFRRQIFKQLLNLPCEFYDRNASGQLLSMIVYNSAQVASASTEALTTLVQSGFLVIGLLIVMFSISWKLSLIFFATVPLIVFVIKMSGKRLRGLNRHVQDTMGGITHTAEESIEGYKVVRSFDGEQ